MKFVLVVMVIVKWGYGASVDVTPVAHYNDRASCEAAQAQVVGVLKAKDSTWRAVDVTATCVAEHVP